MSSQKSENQPDVDISPRHFQIDELKCDPIRYYEDEVDEEALALEREKRKEFEIRFHAWQQERDRMRLKAK